MNRIALIVSLVLPLLLILGCGNDIPETTPRFGTAVPPRSSASTTLPKLPFQATLDAEAVARYDRLTPAQHKDLDFYAEAVGNRAARLWLFSYPKNLSVLLLPEITVPLPALERALTKKEVSKLYALDSRIRDPFVKNWEYGLKIHAPDPSDPTSALAFTDPAAFVTGKTEEYEGQLKEVLMAIPAELPPIEEILSSEAVAQYRRWHPDMKEEFWNDVGGIYARGMTVGRGNFPPLTDSEIKEFFSTIAASISQIQAQ